MFLASGYREVILSIIKFLRGVFWNFLQRYGRQAGNFSGETVIFCGQPL